VVSTACKEIGREELRGKIRGKKKFSGIQTAKRGEKKTTPLGFMGERVRPEGNVRENAGARTITNTEKKGRSHEEKADARDHKRNRGFRGKGKLSGELLPNGEKE